MATMSALCPLGAPCTEEPPTRLASRDLGELDADDAREIGAPLPPRVCPPTLLRCAAPPQQDGF